MTGETSETIFNPGGHPSRLSLARLLAGDLEADGRITLEAHIRACPHCSGVFENAKAEAAAFARRHPHRKTAAGGRSREKAKVRESGLGWLRRLREVFDGGFGMRPALAGFALLALASVIWVANGRMNASRGNDLSAKGSPRFQAYLNGKPAHGDTLACAPMDTLQLLILAEEPVHYAVLYRDDDGPLTAYLIGDADGGKALGSPRGEPLPHSLVLGPGWIRETLFCVWSPHAFTPGEAQAAAGGDSAGGLRVQIIPLANHGR